MTTNGHLLDKSPIIECLKEHYGTIARVFITKKLIKEKPEIKDFLNWIDSNTSEPSCFLSRFKFSTFLPYIFLDVKSNDSIISIGDNFAPSCEIITDALKKGYFFINETDIKAANEDYNFNHDNYCVISHPIIDMPNIQKFDKVLCLAPSTKDGFIFNGSAENKEFTLDKAIENHKEQKKYLISSLEKVKVGGICVYSTFSLNPFENEAVINSVLIMEQFKGKFEIVDCSLKYQEIKRNKGFNSWDMNYVPETINDEELLESLSSNSIVDNIDK
ncbi:hypothetical protein M9Y10_031896 [Tritrichomonas musculus]|uniref:SAM-dependent methyltransferase RsmB-F/NOP2-type catalytic core domain-containing protein n=1 Tax=Tritrichomonas musculus TaxID=1915356 RepID=A0ABR2H1P5_9EUKA